MALPMTAFNPEQLPDVWKDVWNRKDTITIGEVVDLMINQFCVSEKFARMLVLKYSSAEKIIEDLIKYDKISTTKADGQ